MSYPLYLLLLITLWGHSAAAETSSVFTLKDGTICGTLEDSPFGPKVIGARFRDGSTRLTWAEEGGRIHTRVAWDAGGRLSVLQKAPDMSPREVTTVAQEVRTIFSPVFEKTETRAKSGMNACEHKDRMQVQ